MTNNWHTEIESFPENIVLIVRGALKAGLFRETPERKLAILRTMNNHLNTEYAVPEEKRFNVSVETTIAGPMGTVNVPPGGILNVKEHNIVLDKVSLVSYLTHFAKALMANNIAGWDNGEPDLLFPLKFSHSLFFSVAPNMYAKALSEGKLMLPGNGGTPPPNTPEPPAV